VRLLRSAVALSSLGGPRRLRSAHRHRVNPDDPLARPTLLSSRHSGIGDVGRAGRAPSAPRGQPVPLLSTPTAPASDAGPGPLCRSGAWRSPVVAALLHRPAPTRRGMDGLATLWAIPKVFDPATGHVEGLTYPGIAMTLLGRACYGTELADALDLKTSLRPAFPHDHGARIRRTWPLLERCAGRARVHLDTPGLRHRRVHPARRRDMRLDGRARASGGCAGLLSDDPYGVEARRPRCPCSDRPPLGPVAPAIAVVALGRGRASPSRAMRTVRRGGRRPSSLFVTPLISVPLSVIDVSPRPTMPYAPGCNSDRAAGCCHR